MPFDIVRFIQDYNIPSLTEGKNCAPGWININCPFCGDRGFHLGFDISSGYCNCWKCGPKNTIDLIAFLLRTSNKEAKEIVRQLFISEKEGRNRQKQHFIKKAKKRNPNITEIKFPIGAGKLEEVHKRYLLSRKFDPAFIENKYKVLGTKHIGRYKHRLIIPIYMNGVLISYQSRDITERSNLKHKACNEKEELIHYKTSVYNIDNANDYRVIITEGIMDAWRIGDDCVATYGVGVTPEQVLAIKRKFKKVFILYDPDGAGLVSSGSLHEALSILGVKVEVIDLDPGIDPSDLSDDAALYLKKDLFKIIY